MCLINKCLLSYLPTYLVTFLYEFIPTNCIVGARTPKEQVMLTAFDQAGETSPFCIFLYPQGLQSYDR